MLCSRSTAKGAVPLRERRNCHLLTSPIYPDRLGSYRTMNQTCMCTVVVDGRFNHDGERVATGTVQDLFCDESITGFGDARTQQGSVTLKSWCGERTVMARSMLMDVGNQVTELAPECMSLWCGQTVDALGQGGTNRAVDVG